MAKPTKKLVRGQLTELKRAINLILRSKLRDLCNAEERELLGQAYLSLNHARNSLHRYLVKDSANG